MAASVSLTEIDRDSSLIEPATGVTAAFTV